MFELGGVTVTWGMGVLAFALGATVVRLAWRRPRAVAILAALVAAVHAVVYWTTYLDATRVASVRGTAIDRTIDAFRAVAGALDTTFTVIGRAIGWAFDALAGVSMPGASVSVLEFGGFLLSVAVVSALGCGALVRIVRWVDGAPLGAWLAALGVVFGAAGVVWTWLPVGVAELTALHALLVVGAMGGGVAIAAVVLRIPTPAVRKRMRTQ